MKRVFADTSYWIALFNPEDDWAKDALRATKELGEVQLVTTQEVLTEFLNYFAAFGLAGRRQASEAVREILTSKDVTVIAQTPDSFLAGLDLYESSRGCNQTDCASVCAMREEGIGDILSARTGFQKAGFKVWR